MLRVTVLVATALQQFNGVPQQIDVSLPRDAATVAHLKTAIHAARAFPPATQKIAAYGTTEEAALPDTHNLAAAGVEQINVLLFLSQRLDRHRTSAVAQTRRSLTRAPDKSA
jgi:hypothetical protein